MIENTCEYTSQPNFKYFDQIRKIPRMSFHEDKIADYLVRFAEDFGLWYHRDEIGNVIIKKPGTGGKENREPIILQAHTDMVCEKEPGSNHDFSADPIDVYIEDGWMKAKGTTLGADDGAGVANILGILSETGLVHPPLECVFTVQEENGMGGARNLDYSLLSAKRMVGLDGIKEGTTIVSASAVYGGQIKKDITIDERQAEKDTSDDGEPVEAGAAAAHTFTLTVSGLTSGHGGLNIGDERANAIKVAARILYHLNQEISITLCDMYGGSLVHVIPGECIAVFRVDEKIKTEEVLRLTEALSRQIKEEYVGTDPQMTVHCSAVGTSTDSNAETGIEPKCIKMKCFEKGCSDEILTMLYLLPVGAAKRNGEHLERVEGSWNLSTLRIIGNQIVMDYICRANYPVEISELKNTAAAFAETFGGFYEKTFSYPGHHVREDSPLTRIWEKVYKQHSGQALERMYLHSALDAGTIYEGLNEIDIIVVMPTVLDVHTPRERMDIASFARTYGYLKDILAMA